MVSVRVPIGRRSVVVMTTAVGLLSLLTGIIHITSPAPIGVVQPYIPAIVSDMAGFTGAMTGFVILLCAYLLKQGRRVGWYGVLLLLPLSAIQGLIQASMFSIPLILLSVIAIPTVVLNRSKFNRPLALDATQIAAGVAIIGAFAYGTFGSFALRDQYTGVETMLDAFYYTLITATTVGYGDATPETQVARLFGISVVVFATASFAVFLGTLLAPAIEARFTRALGRMTESELERLDNHVVLIGFGDLTVPVIESLDDRVEYLIIEDRDDIVPRIQSREFHLLVGSGTDEQTLRQARASRARAIIIATDDDARDVLAILTARDVAPNVRIVAAATNTENVQKMRNAGASVVISPATIGGRLLSDAAFREDFDPSEQLESILDDQTDGAN